MNILDARSSTNLLVVFGSIFILIFVFWGYGETFASMNERKSIEEQLKIWESRLPDSYRYDLSFGCMTVKSISVNVINSVHYYNQKEVNLESDEIELIELFEVVEKARNQAYRESSEFHEIYGFPTKVKIDWAENTVDDECFYEVSAFESLETQLDKY